MSLEDRLAAFRFVRDIPYKIALSSDEQDYCCSTKVTMLEKLLNNMDLKARRILCTFDWTDTPIPADILALPYDKNDVTHIYLQVLVPETGQWIDCDPTWDIGLEKAGFPIAHWDGKTATPVAVKAHHIYSEAETQRIQSEYTPDMIARHLNDHHEFYGAINEWLAEIR